MIRQFELVELVRAYNPGVDESLLNRAYVFGVKAHGEQKRASGEPYFNHPVEVAAILTELKLDDATIVTALLHDTVEDTDATSEEIAGLFGQEIADLVDGVTKLSQLELASKEHAQAENFRKLLMAVAKDPRVLLVKLTDRLHNMRTIGHLRPEKRQRIARETIEIYAPLAGRMGMQHMREELEDIAFGVLHADARKSIMRRFVHLKQTQGEDAIPKIVAALEELLSADEVVAEVYGREKRPYSIWSKMQSKDVSFEQLSDIIAFRVIAKSESDCYRALGAIHRAWRAVPERFKDYISGPKSNGYRSIHTTVVGPNGARIEVQIRTEQMHEVNETGVAAHWAYKGGMRSQNPFAVDPHRWLRDLVDRVERGDPPQDFLEEAKMEMTFDQVFCFTPKGDVIGLPRGATALDFAYAIHTDVGHTAVGAKVNGKRSPLWTPVRNGQTVEILQSKGQKPSPVWQEMVRSGRARAAIRRTLRDQERHAAARLGRGIVEVLFERAGAAYSAKVLDTAARKLGHSDGEALLAEVGAARITARQALEAVYPEKAASSAKVVDALDPIDPNRPQVVPTRSGQTGRDTDDSPQPALAMPAAPCCSPLPGERIIALREPGLGHRLHAIDCERLADFEDDMDRWLDVAWAPNAGDHADHLAHIALVLVNEPGALGQVCTLIGAAGANIDDMTFADRKPDFFRLDIDLEVRDLRHLTNILTTLSAQPVVAQAERIRNAAAMSMTAPSGESDDTPEPPAGASTASGSEQEKTRDAAASDTIPAH
ncbi:MAG: bifunctional (p)ppGpp synthetase/guanosine-3',5'-bis(diphosphate) 3'-pyrophosphohydrolase [Pseudomonadota bacterium]